MNVVGIDPGKTGGLAFWTQGRIVETIRMPIVGDEVDFRRIHEWLYTTRAAGLDAIVIEKVGPMPHDRPQSAFRFGYNTGGLDGVVASLGHPLIKLTPQQWKKANGLSGKDKDASRMLAMQLWPHIRDDFKFKVDDGRAEAGLIARAHIAMFVKGAA